MRVALLVAVVALQAYAQSPNDLAAPESPAFTVLGMSPQNITRPSSPKALAAALLNGMDQSGNFQTGFAIDTTPYLMILGVKVSLASYSQHYVTRLLARTSLSLGSTRGATSTDKSTRLASGLRATLFDLGDPLGDAQLESCTEAAAAAYETEFVPQSRIDSMEKELAARESETEHRDGEAGAAFVERQLKTMMDRRNLEKRKAKNGQLAAKLDADRAKCAADSRKRNFNRSSMVVAGAPAWISATGQNGDMKWNGGGAWTSIAYGFEGMPALRNTTQILFEGLCRSRETVADPASSGHFLVQNRAVVGGGVRVGRPNFQMFWEGSYVHRHAAGAVPDNSFETAVSAEARITDGLWFNLGIGTESGRSNSANKLFLLTNFKWGLSPDKTSK
jgi:hypothetical protein